ALDTVSHEFARSPTLSALPPPSSTHVYAGFPLCCRAPSEPSSKFADTTTTGAAALAEDRVVPTIGAATRARTAAPTPILSNAFRRCFACIVAPLRTPDDPRSGAKRLSVRSFRRSRQSRSPVQMQARHGTSKETFG